MTLGYSHSHTLTLPLPLPLSENHLLFSYFSIFSIFFTSNSFPKLHLWKEKGVKWENATKCDENEGYSYLWSWIKMSEQNHFFFLSNFFSSFGAGLDIWGQGRNKNGTELAKIVKPGTFSVCVELKSFLKWTRFAQNVALHRLKQNLNSNLSWMFLFHCVILRWTGKQYKFSNWKYNWLN